MPSFNTPAPISVTVDLGVGEIRIVASDRADTIVEVRPTDAAKKADVAAAQQARVEYASGRLLVKAAKGWRQYTPRGGGESIDVQIELPTGSHLHGEAGIAAVHCTGRLGECLFKTGIGEIHVDYVGGPLELKTGVGDITVGQALGPADITTGSGGVHVDSIGGSAVIKNANGDTWIGAAAGDVRVNAANGKIVIDRAHGSVAAKTANGDVRLGEIDQGPVVAETAYGNVDLGIREGVAAWLDVSTRFGSVHSDLETAERPAAGEPSVEVRARTSLGDIAIHRVPTSQPTR
jgi:DUF4097 and DUF4098 domain-containing protein YvlB